MPDSTRIDTDRVKSFFKHLATTSKKYGEVDGAKEKLNAQIKKIKTQAITPRKRKAIEKEIAKLELYVSDVIQKEIVLLKGQSESDRLTKELKAKVGQLEEELVITRTEDIDVISELKNKVNELSDKLSEVKNIDIQLVQELSGRIDNLHVKVSKTISMEDLQRELQKIEEKIGELKTSDITANLRQEIEKFEQNLADMRNNVLPLKEMRTNIRDLKQKMEEVIKIKEERDKKIDQIEKKVQEGFGFNQEGILAIEEKIELLENKLFKLKEAGKFSEEDIKKLQQKIVLLKDKSKNVRMEKLGGVEEPVESDTHLELRDMPPLPEPTGRPKFNIPSLGDSKGLEFSTKEPLELGDLPPPPPLPPQKRKGFFSKLLGK